MKIDKTCIVCGKSFLAANPLYCLCSNDCRAKRKAAYNKRYEKEHITREQKRKRNKKYREQHKKKYHCKTCGTVLPNGCQKYCLDCLLRAYQSKEQRSWAKDVLHSRGYDKEAIINEIEERRKNDRT